MRVLGLLSFFAEKPEHLAATVTSLHGHVDGLVAVDGAYRLFPDPSGFSGRDAHDAIRDTAHDHGIECAIYTPPGPWQGNEVEKRTYLFVLGHAFATPYEDWLFVVDADETVTHADLRWRERLEHTSEDVAVVEHGEPGVRPRLERRLFRAHPRGIRVERAHYFYLDGDERVLWGPGQISRDIVDLRMLHQPLQRDKDRNRRRNRYYEERLLTHEEAFA